MKPFYRSYIISFFLFLGALTFYSGARFLGEKNESLRAENTVKESVIGDLKNIKTPEQYLSLLEKSSPRDLPKQLTLTAQKNYLSIEKSIPLPGNKIEITLQGELDTDIFAYLHDLSEHFPDTLSLQEVGLFRDQNHVMGKVIFKVFPKGIHHD